LGKLADEVRELLPGALCEEGDCLICYYKADGDIFIIAISKGKKYYAKVVPFSKAPPGATCEAIYALPHGLYAFGSDLRELAENLKRKLAALHPN